MRREKRRELLYRRAECNIFSTQTKICQSPLKQSNVASPRTVKCFSSSSDVQEPLRSHDGVFKADRDSVHKVLREIGFRYSNVNGRKFLLEKNDVASARTKFLREMKALKRSGYDSFVYLDETWINQNHTVRKCWIDPNSEKPTGIKPPTGKGSRLIVLHAGTKNGFVPNCKLVFQAKNDGDYHIQMNHTVFKEWFISQLIPKLPASSIILMDNASYHFFQIDKPPTASDRKVLIKDWLIAKGETPGDDLLKNDLLAMVKQHTSRWPRKYEIDNIASEHGHKVVLSSPPPILVHCPKEVIGRQQTIVEMGCNGGYSGLRGL
ncbi:uncharacterized protein LOC135224853 [Macrobrachium nipponense]|uniref:uncharacterized protein LOC135224853 n=1 Tax=Macrobrachium nipponense TaxID=159736 RepID=UPI0030C7F3A3